MDETVETLLRRAKSGDRAAFEALSEQLRERLLGLARSRMSPRLQHKIEPEDIVQETFLRAFESIGAFRGTEASAFFSWLGSIAEHLIWNAARKRSLKEALAVIETPGEGVSPSRGLRRKERLARLQSCLGTLQADQREVVLLAKIEGLNSKEIAERLGRPEGTVRQLLARGLHALRERFGETDSLHLPDGGFE